MGAPRHSEAATTHCMPPQAVRNLLPVNAITVTGADGVLGALEVSDSDEAWE